MKFERLNNRGIFLTHDACHVDWQRDADVGWPVDPACSSLHSSSETQADKGSMLTHASQRGTGMLNSGLTPPPGSDTFHFSYFIVQSKLVGHDSTQRNHILLYAWSERRIVMFVVEPGWESGQSGYRGCASGCHSKKIIGRCPWAYVIHNNCHFGFRNFVVGKIK